MNLNHTLVRFFVLSAFTLTGGLGAVGCSTNVDPAPSEKQTSGADGGAATPEDSTGATPGNSSGGGGTIAFSCEAKPACPNAAAPTAEAKENCEKVLTTKCADSLRAAGTCSLNKPVCKADGTYDEDATSEGPCKAETEAFATCLFSE